MARAAEEILGDRRETPPPFAIGVFGAAATVEQVRGRQAGADRLLSLLVRVAEAKERAPWAQGWIAGLQARRGATEDARRMLLHQLEAPAPSRGFLLEALCEVLEEGGLWGEVGSVAEMARSWAEEAGLVALPFFADRLEGRAALAEGDADRAVALLARAGEGFGQLGAPWDQARAHLYLGEALAAKGDIETARKRLAGALSEFERLGSVRELDRSRALLATLA